MLLFAFFSNALSQQELQTYESSQITVTATRLDSKFAGTRNVTTINKIDIEKLPVQSVPQLLNYAFGISMNSRGIPGVQSDPSLRGAGFEQVLILLDGIRMNDPQTGHHNMNLPVTVQDIEKIEVLRGQSSTLYGPDAFGGVINIITKTARRDRIRLDLSGGSFGSYKTSASVSLPGTKQFSNSFTIEKTGSDGFREDTDFQNHIANWKTDFQSAKTEVRFNAGYVSKDFGANDFYVKGFDHYEEVRSFNSGLKTKYTATPSLSFTTRVNYKKHDDYFLLSRSNPAIYKAEHTTERVVFETSGHYKAAALGEFTLGIESSFENVESSSLGKHNIRRVSFFGEYGKTILDDLLLNGCLRIDDHNEWGTVYNPSFSLAYVINSGLIAKTSIGRAFRAPTFIELYSPAASRNIGNSGLKPEKATAFDAGVDYNLGKWLKGSSVYFTRWQSETIDWIKENQEDDWRAVNYFDVHTQGFEQSLSCFFNEMLSLRVNYSFLDQNKKQTDFISKYALIHPTHLISIIPTVNAADYFSIQPVFTYKDRPGLGDYIVVDASIMFEVSKIRFKIEGLNLTDSDYQEIRDVPMPGAAVYFGFSYIY